MRLIRTWVGAVLALGAAGCGAGQAIRLGDSSPVPLHFDPPEIVPELASSSRTDNPTLTADLLEIYFTSDRASGNGDVWFASRPTASVPFDAPQAVAAVNTPWFETSSAISADGLTLWFGSDRPGGPGAVDVWVSQRASRQAVWSTPVTVVSLCSPSDDIPRPPGQHALVMPMASARPAPQNPGAAYQTYFAPRPGPAAPFGAPVAVPDLNLPDRSTVDAFLTDDGLTLFYSSARLAPADAGPDAGAATSDLYVAWRRSTSEGFSSTQPLGDLNTPASERDPWLTPDGRTLYFTSDRTGVLVIYTACVQPR